MYGLRCWHTQRGWTEVCRIMQYDAAVLGANSAQIESEYLERLNKTRFGMDCGWRPPGLMLKGGGAAQRRLAFERLKDLAEQDGFFCSYIALGPRLPLANTLDICSAAISAADLSGFLNPAQDALENLKGLAASARRFERNGWVILIDNMDRFEGIPRNRAASYREIARWMGSLQEKPTIGLFCVLGITPEFEQSVADPNNELATIRDDLRSTGSAADKRLLDAAEIGIFALDHETTVRELLVLEHPTGS